MSELNNIPNERTNIRRALLATASSFVLISYAASAQVARAADSDRPVVWIELGGQLESMTGRDDLFTPHFDGVIRSLGLPSATAIENTLGRSYGGEGSLSFQPGGSDWVFTASARYGRTSSARHVHKETDIVGPPWAQYHFKTLNQAPIVTQTFTAYVEQSSKSSEAHTIVDFQAGKDVGLGLFGHGTHSIVSLGARYVQLNTTSEMKAESAPDAEFSLLPGLFKPKYAVLLHHHNSASLAERYSDLHAFGPSISLINTTGLLGNTEEGQLGVDWGVNAAVLFGHQRTKVHHQSTVRDMGGNNGGTSWRVNYATTNPVDSTRSRHVTVPNLGGFAGISYRFSNAKLAAGYRADFFFGALDRGLDTRDTVTTGFHGPYATFSVGLGG